MHIAVAILRVPEGLDYSSIIADFDDNVQRQYDVNIKGVEMRPLVDTTNQVFLRYHHTSVDHFNMLFFQIVFMTVLPRYYF